MPQTHRNRTQNARLSVPIVAVQNRQRRVERQFELLNGAVVFNLHRFQFHKNTSFVWE